VGAAKVAVAVGAWVALGRLVGISVGVGTREHPATRTKSKKLKHTVNFSFCHSFHCKPQAQSIDGSRMGDVPAVKG